MVVVSVPEVVKRKAVDLDGGGCDWKARKGTALVVLDQLTVELTLPLTTAVASVAWAGVKRKAVVLDGGGWHGLSRARFAHSYLKCALLTFFKSLASGSP
ncbi:hypothetical protein TYRP_019700 [Tyrophagus putrescentiae]|nr:hypothetical protein TYRP_019700 [Tyrophagus putrescentiae]